MSILNTAATLPPPPADDVVGTAQEGAGGDATFEGEIQGLLRLIVTDLKGKRTPNPWQNNALRDQVVWLFSVVGQESRGTLAWYTSTSLHEKSHLPSTVAALKKTLAAGQPIRKGDFIGAICDGLVKMEPGKKDPTKKFPRVKELLPIA